MRGTEPTFHVSETGGLLDSVGAFPGREMFIATTGGGVRATVRIFGRSTVYAVAEDYFFVGTNDRYEIARYSPSGVLGTLIRTDHAPRPIQRGDRDAFMRARTEGRSPAERRAYEQRYDGNDPPPNFPAFAELIADRSGHLWVGNYPIPTEENRWFSVFDPDGRWLTDVDVPDGISILEIRLHYVLALFTDELDVEHVRLYPLDRN